MYAAVRFSKCILARVIPSTPNQCRFNARIVSSFFSCDQTMSWLARSLANSLRLEDDEEDDSDFVPAYSLYPTPSNSTSEDKRESQLQQREEGDENGTQFEEEAHSRGVKEDLTELKQTLSRQFWGVASFLAPPVNPSAPSHSHSYLSDSDRDQFESDQSVTVERGVKPSDPADVSQMDLNYDRLEEVEGEDEEFEDYWEDAVGITDEALTFASNIAMHPETWLDFPIDEEEDTDDFELSDAQKGHAFTIERLAPRLAALRIELCPCHMSESYFWKVYFVLLLSRLNKHDAETLSTPQVVAARAMWMLELQKQTKQESNRYGRSTSYSKDSPRSLCDDDGPLSSNYTRSEDMILRPSSTAANYEIEKNQVESDEIHFVDKSVIVERPVIKTENKNIALCRSSKEMVEDYDDETDEWPEEDSELGGCSGTIIPLENEEDISFSDLENDDVIVPMKTKKCLE